MSVTLLWPREDSKKEESIIRILKELVAMDAVFHKESLNFVIAIYSRNINGYDSQAINGPDYLKFYRFICAC